MQMQIQIQMEIQMQLQLQLPHMEIKVEMMGESAAGGEKGKGNAIYVKGKASRVWQVPNKIAANWMRCE